MDTVDEIEAVVRLTDKIRDPKQRELALNLLSIVLELREDNAKIRERILDLEREIRILNNANPSQGFLFAKNIVNFRKIDDDQQQPDNLEGAKDEDTEEEPETLGYGPFEYIEEEDD